LGEHPIDGWETCFLEVPKNGEKKDITGRMNTVSSQGTNSTVWDLKRIVNLPKYRNCKNVNMDYFKTIIKHWNYYQISDDIPVLAIALKCHGNYSDLREAQYISVLLIWNDSVCRIITLEWFEGPLEDCITPEWYLKSTHLLNLELAFKALQDSNKKSNLINPVYSIFLNPLCLGAGLNGQVNESSYKQWGDEWKYRDHSELLQDLDLLFSRIQEIFSTVEVS